VCAHGECSDLESDETELKALAHRANRYGAVSGHAAQFSAVGALHTAQSTPVHPTPTRCWLPLGEAGPLHFRGPRDRQRRRTVMGIGSLHPPSRALQLHSVGRHRPSKRAAAKWSPLKLAAVDNPTPYRWYRGRTRRDSPHRGPHTSLFGFDCVSPEEVWRGED